jgi:uncharacterized protein (DUF2236 family)
MIRGKQLDGWKLASVDVEKAARESRMEQPHRASSDTEATRADLERYIADLTANVRRPIEGIFGADSASWKINRESALFLGAGRAALLQLAHPWVAAALDRHSSLLTKPIARFHNTFRVVFTMIFGSSEQAFASARSLYRMHTRITGELPDAVAGYEKGSRYEALHIPALRWVYATLIESAVIAYECVLPPLTTEERARYYAESKILAGLFGLPASALPADWNAFEAYIAGMFTSDALGVSERARYMAQSIMTGANSWVHVPRWYQALTAEWLPLRFRDEFRCKFGLKEQSSAKGAHAWLPRVYTKLPNALRHVGPYQEAQDRLHSRAPGILTQRTNLFWIGQPRMPFAK